MDKQREEFEQWWQQEGYDNQLSNIQGVMFNRIKRGMFAAWQASRASIVVELPDTDNYWNGTSGHEIFNHRQFAADSCDALRDIGLSIKGE